MPKVSKERQRFHDWFRVDAPDWVRAVAEERPVIYEALKRTYLAGAQAELFRAQQDSAEEED